jgi:Domain of unknown function (DUF1918)
LDESATGSTNLPFQGIRRASAGARLRGTETMGATAQIRHVQPGDIVQVSGRHVGDAGRTGEIAAVLGQEDHPHYLVRWEDDRESILYPGEGTSIRPGAGRVASAD